MLCLRQLLAGAPSGSPLLSFWGGSFPSAPGNFCEPSFQPSFLSLLQPGDSLAQGGQVCLEEGNRVNTELSAAIRGSLGGLGSPSPLSASCSLSHPSFQRMGHSAPSTSTLVF